MNLSAVSEELMRRRLLEDIYDRMTDDEKNLFVQMTLQQRSSDDITKALQLQSQKIDRLQQTQQTFAQGFLSNIAGNAAYGGALWLLRRLAGLVK